MTPIQVVVIFAGMVAAFFVGRASLRDEYRRAFETTSRAEGKEPKT